MIYMIVTLHYKRTNKDVVFTLTNLSLIMYPLNNKLTIKKIDVKPCYINNDNITMYSLKTIALHRRGDS